MPIRGPVVKPPKARKELNKNGNRKRPRPSHLDEGESAKESSPRPVRAGKRPRVDSKANPGAEKGLSATAGFGKVDRVRRSS